MRPYSPPRNPPELTLAPWLPPGFAAWVPVPDSGFGFQFLDLPQPILPQPIYPAGFYPGGFNPRKNDIMKPTHYVITPAGHILASFASASGAWAYAQEMNATLPPDHDENDRAWAARARIPFVPTRFFVTTEKDF